MKLFADIEAGPPKVRKGVVPSLPASSPVLKSAPSSDRLLPEAGPKKAGEVRPSSPAVEAVEPEATAPAAGSAASSSEVEIPAGEPVENTPVEEAVTLKDILAVAAKDDLFYCKYFFPKTFRQPFALYHGDVFALLSKTGSRYINILLSRDGAKTTILRAFLSKRIGFALSRTILYIGASQDKAKQSVGWIKRQIENNQRYTTAFGLRPGKPWTDEHLVVEHAVEGCVIHILAYGITGSVRGVNLDDYRPDMIIIDDCMNDENTATREQRTKVEDLILGALKESLSPETETPDAKMVLLNTPQDFEDVAQRALKDPQFESIVQGCWTKETENLPTEYQESSWPARYPSETLRKEKRAAIARNKYSIFAREKEVKLVTAENSAFKPEWIKFYGEGEVEPEPPLHEMWVEIAVDPVPPPTQKALEKGDFKTDFEAISAVGRWRNKYYVLETMYNRGHEPNWTVVAIQDMATRWRAKLITVEAVAYQVTLAWLLRQAMRTSGRYWPIHEFKDRRKKYDRIVDGISGPLSNGQLFFRKDQTTLISQVQHYPGKNPSGTYDDVIESVAVALASLQNGFVGDGADENGMVNEDGYESLGSYRGAP